MMYDELVKRLRSQCRGYGKECEDCNADGNCRSQMKNEAADAIEDLQKQLAKSEADNINLTGWLAEEHAKHQWVPVEERLPEEKINPITHDFESIICSTNFGDVRVYKYGTPIGWNEPHFWHGAGIMDRYVTNWMPLPEPPKGET